MPGLRRRRTRRDLAREAGISAAGWVDERLNPGGVLRWVMFRKVPKGSDNFAYTLGVGALFAFLNQAVTGVALAMFYEPSPGRAYESIRHLTNDVFLGEFVRGLHKWGATVMVVMVFLHLGVNFLFGAYKYPREMNWVIGVVLLVLTMVMGFTGYLLPFDQRAYWATIVGLNINGTGPFVGPFLSDFLRGGAEFGAITLQRFYIIHMIVLPGAIVTMIGAHLYLVVKLGTTSHPWTKLDPPDDASRPV